MISFDRALAQQVTGDFASKIKSCYFFDENSTASVELICKQNDSHFNDNCYSMLFEDESMDINRAKVMHLRIGQCQSNVFDNSLAELFSNLISLDISHFGLDQTINEQNMNFKSLQILHASNNQLNKMKDAIFGHTKHIRKIDFSYNKMVSIVSSCFKGADSLTHINLSHNAIEYLQISALERMQHLHVIDLSYNKLYTFDMSVFRNNLEMQEIHIRNNDLRRLVHDLELVPNFTSLRVFRADENRIDNLSGELIKKIGQSLEELDLTFTNCGFMNVIHRPFPGFHRLKHVGLKGTSLSSSFNFSVFEHPNELRYLDLSSNSIYNINFTSEYGQFINLEALYLQGNILKSLDGATSEHFPKLSEIDISYNMLPCEIVTKFVQHWTNISVLVNPCDQYKYGSYGLSYFINENTAYTFEMSLNAAIFVLVVFIVKFKRWFCTKCKQYCKSKQFADIESDIIVSNPIEELIYEEPIYCEIASISDTYDRLAFRGLTPSTVKNHYDIARISKYD